MSIKNIYQYLSSTAFCAGLALFCMLCISFFAENHITQQHFELVDDASAYAQALVANSDILRRILTFDNMFVVFYTTSFTFLYMALQQHQSKLNVLLGYVAVLGTGLLDFYENHHILTFLTEASKGIALDPEALESQMTLSQLKFHLSYLSFFLFSFSLPSKTLLEKLLRYSMFFVQLPVGVLVYTASADLQPIFGLLRYIFMFSGLMMIAYIFYRRVKQEDFEI